MQIVPGDEVLIEKAEALAKSVFKSDHWLVHLTFLVLKKPDHWFVKIMAALMGIKDYLSTDVMIDDTGAVLGTIGLYRINKDYQDAVWISWFCVAPAARQQGVGQALLDHAVSQAVAAGYKLIRLYTSTDPNEAAAQVLYEKNGFREYRRSPLLFTTLIYREKRL